MTLQEIYDLAIEMGMKADSRGEAHVKKLLAKAKKDYEDLPEKKKKYFDRETLHNPYADSRILFGDPKIQVKKVLTGIDTDSTDLLLLDRLNQKGANIDVYIGHHPTGFSLTGLHEVMDMQIDEYANLGMAENVADALMRQRIADIQRRIHPSNYYKTVDTARLLTIPLMNLHTMWDNMSYQFINTYVSKKKYDTVGDILEDMMEIPEYQEAASRKNPPIIVSGSEKSRVGKIAVFFAGGTNPSKEIYAEMAKTGIGTLIDMHIPEDALEEVKKLHMNVINAGHMASDSIGGNLFYDVLEEKHKIEVIPGSGFIRVKRKVH